MGEVEVHVHCNGPPWRSKGVGAGGEGAREAKA